jgi:DNA-binding transcriptional regulator YiaG
METGKAIREMRKKLNMTQTKLSELRSCIQREFKQ